MTVNLTETEKKVFEDFCRFYSDFMLSRGEPIPRILIQQKTGLSKYMTLKTLRSLRQKGLVKLVREYYEDTDELGVAIDWGMMIGYRVTKEGQDTEMYERIEKEVENEIKRRFNFE